MANSLTDVREKLIKDNIAIIAFVGHTLETEMGRIIMDDQFIYLNREPLTDKQFQAKVAEFKQAKEK